MDSANPTPGALATIARRVRKTDPTAPVRRLRGQGLGVHRGGDSNGPAVALNRSQVHEDANGQRVLVGQDLLRRSRDDPGRHDFEATLRETRDEADAAHTARDAAGLLLPARMLRGRASRRLYPACLIVGGDAHGFGGVGPDSACEIGEWVRAQFAREGVELGARRRSGDEWAAEAASVVGGGEALRNLLHRKTRAESTAEERELERQASVLLAGVARNPGRTRLSVEGRSAQ